MLFRSVSLLANLPPLLLLTVSCRRCLLRSFLSSFGALGGLCRCLGGGGSRGFASGRCRFGCHCMRVSVEVFGDLNGVVVDWEIVTSQMKWPGIYAGGQYLRVFGQDA